MPDPYGLPGLIFHKTSLVGYLVRNPVRRIHPLKCGSMKTECLLECLLGASGVLSGCGSCVHLNGIAVDVNGERFWLNSKSRCCAAYIQYTSTPQGDIHTVVEFRDHVHAEVRGNLDVFWRADARTTSCSCSRNVTL